MKVKVGNDQEMALSESEYSRTILLSTLTNMTLAKGHLSKTKSQGSDIRTIGSLVV